MLQINFGVFPKWGGGGVMATSKVKRSTFYPPGTGH